METEENKLFIVMNNYGLLYDILKYYGAVYNYEEMSYGGSNYEYWEYKGIQFRIRLSNHPLPATGTLSCYEIRTGTYTDDEETKFPALVLRKFTKKFFSYLESYHKIYPMQGSI